MIQKKLLFMVVLATLISCDQKKDYDSKTSYEGRTVYGVTNTYKVKAFFNDNDKGAFETAEKLENEDQYEQAFYYYKKSAVLEGNEEGLYKACDVISDIKDDNAFYSSREEVQYTWCKAYYQATNPTDEDSWVGYLWSNRDFESYIPFTDRSSVESSFDDAAEVIEEKVEASSQDLKDQENYDEYVQAEVEGVLEFLDSDAEKVVSFFSRVKERNERNARKAEKETAK